MNRVPPFESLEGRRYLYTPDLYIPILGGGCICGGCVKCLGGPPVAESVDAARDRSVGFEGTVVV